MAREDNKSIDKDKDYQEWKSCNEIITKLDTILIDLRKYGFSVATGLTTAGSILGLQSFTTFQPFQIVIIFATMALIDVLYWLDVYYQTILSAVILRTQLLERKLSFGVDIYISRFYMRHRIGKVLHMLYIGFLISLGFLGGYIVYQNDLVSKTGMVYAVWILFMSVPIIFVFCIWYFFDRSRYRTYSIAQAKISNFLRNPRRHLTENGRTIDEEILEFLDSDKEDLGLDLETNEWVFYDQKETRNLGLSSKRLIVTSKRIYGVNTSIIKHSCSLFEYTSVECSERIIDSTRTLIKLSERPFGKALFEIEISTQDKLDDKILERINIEKDKRFGGKQ